jgi:hypothetical protein
LVVHGVKSGTGVGWVSWKKRRGVSPHCPRVNHLHSIAYGA